MPGEARFLGIHPVETRADELNQASHIATWQQLEKDYKSAREWLQKMLELNPSSIAAFSQLGNLAAATGDCGAARTHWQNAAQLIATDGDPDAVPLSRSTKDDFLGGLGTRIRNCK